MRRLVLACLLLVTSLLGGLPAGPAAAMSGGVALPPAPRLAPWMASLVVRGDAPVAARLSCGGALIAPRTVLTAAHCTDGLTTAQVADQAEVHVGATTLSRDPGTVRRIVDVTVHPRYRLLPSPAAPDRPELSSATYDVELLTLDRPVTGVTPLAVASRTARPGRPAMLFGHGVTAPDAGQSDALRAGLFTVGRTASCVTATPATVDRTAMGCAVPVPVATRAEACTGDSGGPLVSLDRRLRPSLIGVFSFTMETAGRPCGATGPAFVTRGDVVAAWVSTLPVGTVR